MPRGVRKVPTVVSLDVFVTEWTKDKSPEAIAKKLGMKVQACKIKAGILRKKGVALKKFEETTAAAQPKVWSVNALNNLIKGIAGPGKPGRPKGSKNKIKVVRAPKAAKASSMEEKFPKEELAAAPPPTEGH